MKAGVRAAWQRLSARHAIAGAAVIAAGAWLVAPHWVELARSPLGLGLGLALAGYLLRRSWWDAASLTLPIAAGEIVEVGLGPILVTVAAASVFAATRRPRFAAAASATLLCLLLIGIRWKQRFAGTALTWHDLQFFFMQFADNVGVMASQPTLLAYSAAALGGVGGIGWVCWRLDREPVRQAAPARQALAAIVALLLTGWSIALLRTEIATFSRMDTWTLGAQTEWFDRPLSGFISTVGRRPEWTPRVTDTTVFREDVRRRMAGSTGAAAPADIVLFLQESQFNPATIEGCPVELCQLDVFRPSPDVVSHGPMQVHVFGGGTWVTEFALAGGVPHTAFGRAGDFAPFNVAPGMRRSFMRSLRAAGYRTVALYPVRGGMMNARTAYAGYGFDRFLDSDDLGLSGSFATTDEEMHAAARRVLAQERRHGQPVFLMVVTIFNHAEHGARLDRVPATLLAHAGRHFRKDVAASVADYVWRTGEFARALGVTRPAVLGAGRPAVLAWFGDHQPPFGNALELRGRIRSVPGPDGSVPAQMQTWYQVVSNRPGVSRDASARAIDVVFLPGLLAQAAGAPLDEWLAANVTVREQCGGLLHACVRAESRAAYLSYLWKDLGAFPLP